MNKKVGQQYYDKLTKKQKIKLQKLIDEIKETAKEVVKDYEVNPPVSGSEGTVVQVHENSPVLNKKDKKNK